MEDHRQEFVVRNDDMVRHDPNNRSILLVKLKLNLLLSTGGEDVGIVQLGEGREEGSRDAGEAVEIA